MKRAVSGALLAACAVLGALLAVALAGPTAAGVVQTPPAPGTTTTQTTTQTTTTTTPEPPSVVPDGVSIGGIAVGGLPIEVAGSLVRNAFETPLVLLHRDGTLQPNPVALGATAYVQGALERARRAAPGTAVPLVVRVRGERVRAYIAKVAKRFERAPVDAQLVLRRLKPYITSGRPGVRIDRPAAVAAIVEALTTNVRFPIRLQSRAVHPLVTRRSFGAVIVIRRGSNRLHLYDGMRLRKTFGVATGESRYPTPLGRFRIVVKWKNPWWHPPNSDWARGQKPIPPGPGNPLGTRWLGISAPGVGIHGTPDAASIGYSVSHGCIRMQIPEAEWLYNHVTVGTPVFIVVA